MESFAKKLGINEKPVLNKAKEIERLIETKKSFSVDASLQSILCLHVAASMKGTDFDKNLAIKLSASSKKTYNAKLYMLEKLLDVQPLTSVKEMCLKFGAMEAYAEADKLKKRFDELCQDDHEDHPMYSAGAVFVVAKSQKISVEKAKIVELARTTWTQLESVIEKMKKLFQSGQTSSSKKTKPKKHALQEILDNIADNSIDDDSKTRKEEEVKSDDEEDYEVWRKRMIKEAHEELEQDAKRPKKETSRNN
ncbi:origin recognition complex subunit 6 isoform X1 [Cloeon dipterum]|uniref:origin recognition complex subunit 6 isoform X1 n=1 Tax=Cloeon dipterum TaxID=197152 RepID=UPI00321FD9C8